MLNRYSHAAALGGVRAAARLVSWQLFILLLLLLPTPGRAQSYSLVANQAITLTTCSGTLYDDGGPTGPGQLNSTSVVTLRPATPGSKMLLLFTEFDIDIGFDQLTIQDGPDSSAPVIGVYSQESPGVIYATNSTGALTLTLRTDFNSLSNGFAAAIACTTQPPPSDLTVGPAQLVPAVVLAGQSVSAEFTLANLAGVTAPASPAAVYLSADSIWSADDLLLASVAHGGLVVGQPFRQTVPLVVPAVGVGSYYALIVADPQNLIPETNEDNNVRPVFFTVVPPDPDLAILNGIVQPSAAAAGGTIRHLLYGENQGSTLALGFTVGYYLSVDSLLSADDVLLGVSPRHTEAAGAGFTYNAVLNLPPATPLGYFYLLAVADHQNLLPEHNEQNNLRATSFEVVPPIIDLSLQAVFVSPDSVAAGGRVAIRYYPYNSGNYPAGPSGVGYYLSTDDVWSGNDLLLGRAALAGLAAGQAIARQDSLLVPPGVAAGRYRVLCVLDPQNVLTEENETNNVGSQPLVITTRAATAATSQLAGAAVSVYPNPARGGRAWVQITGMPGAAAALTLYGSDGRVLAAHQLTLRGRTCQLPVDLPALPAGSYVLRITAGQVSITRRLVVP